jgi:hypothetical protein
MILVYFPMKDRAPRSLGLIPIIGSLLIVAILVVVAVQIYGGGKGEETETLTKSIDRAAGVQCRTQIRNLTVALEFYITQHGHFPSDLNGLEHVTTEMLVCPVTQEPYGYDHETGKVYCPEHGDK